MIHNYFQKWGGGDQSTEQELALLRERGEDVEFYFRHNDEIKDFSKPRLAGLFFETTWSQKSYNEVSETIKRFKPDIIHCQNFFTLVTPAIFYAAARSKVPIVQSLRDFRLLCPIGFFVRNGEVCEECMTHSLWRGIKYGCYRNSSAQTASIALMLKTHRILNTWNKRVNGFVALTEFSRQKFIEGGLPAEKIVVRPNFMTNDPGVQDHERTYALFVGRMSTEKGIKTLLEAWKHIPDLPLKVVGGGDLVDWAKDYLKENNITNVELIGFVKPDEVLEYQRRAKFVIMPSLWYETFGRVILEGYAVGTPAIVSNLGAMAELVEEERTGLRFTPGDADDLARKVRYAIDHPAMVETWGQNARRKVENEFLAERAYERLMDIYGQVLNRAPALT